MFRDGAIFKHIKGRNDPTSCLPLHNKGGSNKVVNKKGKYLTEDQTKFIYDKIESGDETKVRKVNQEAQKNNNPLNIKSKGKEEINLYEKVLVSDVNRLEMNMPQMNQWSMLGDNIKYLSQLVMMLLVV